MKVNWTIPGTTRPEECTIFALMERQNRGETVNSSEVIISYYFIDEALAQDIITNVLKPSEAKLFNQLRAIPPTRFQRPWWVRMFIGPRPITWFDYSSALDLQMDSFWNVWDGVGSRIEDYLQSRQQTASV